MKLFQLEPTNELTRKPRPALYLALSFLLPVVIMVLGLLALHAVPFGEKHSIAISDGQWYVNGLMSFRRLLRGDGSWLYSLRSIGSNNWSSLSWGGIAIFKFLAVFATYENVVELSTWISVLSMALCGLTMYLLLAGLRGHRPDNLIFSTSYALIGFLVVNCYQILFMIGPQMLPLMVLGLLRLLWGRSPLLYILSLAVCIFLNFYFGLMLCIASVLIFLAYLYAEKDQLKGRLGRVFLRYAVSSLIAGLLAAPMWLPALKAFTGGDGRMDQTTASEFQFKENMPFLQIFSKLFTGANSVSELVNGLPNIFCGILTVALVILYFMNKAVPLRRRRAVGAILSFYLLTFYITAFTLAMHGGTHTNWFPYRYSFVFSFLLICVAAEELRFLPELTIAETKKCGVVLLIAALLVFITRYEFITAGTVLLDFALLLLMWLGFYLYKTKPEQAPERFLTLLLLLVVSGNLYANYVISIKNMQDWEKDLEAYQTNYFRYSPLVEGLRQADESFFRMEKDVSESGSVGSDPSLYGYYGVSGSGPSIRMFIHKGLAKLGVNWYDMRHWYSEGIPAATDTLLGLKYLLSERDLEEEKGYELRLKTDDMQMFLNHSALSLSILADAESCELTLTGNVFENLNLVWKTMCGGTEDIFTFQPDVTYTMYNDTNVQSVTSAELRERVSRVEAGETLDEQTGSYIEYSFTAERDGPIYLVDTSIAESSNGLSVPAIRYCGSYAAGDEVTGTFPVNNGNATGELLRGYCTNLVFAYADNALLSEYADRLNQRDLRCTVEKDDHITGSFTAGAGQRLLFTVPWDEGWSCYIDGQKVSIQRTWDLFMSVEAPEGAHTFELRFSPAWLDYGLYLCGAALLGLLVFLPVSRRRRKAEAADIAAAEEAPGAEALEETDAAPETPPAVEETPETIPEPEETP